MSDPGEVNSVVAQRGRTLPQRSMKLGFKGDVDINHDGWGGLRFLSVNNGGTFLFQLRGKGGNFLTKACESSAEMKFLDLQNHRIFHCAMNAKPDPRALCLSYSCCKLSRPRAIESVLNDCPGVSFLEPGKNGS